MLCRNKNWITTISGYNLGWYDEDGSWTPNQALVGSSISDQVLGRISQCQVSDGAIWSLGKRIAQITREPGTADKPGKITNLVLVPVK